MYSGSVASTVTHSAGLGAGHRVVPVDVAAGDQLGLELRPLQDHAARRAVLGQLQRRVEQRLVLDHPARLDAARRGHDHLRAASSMRAASSCAAKPPNTTECTAPSRAQASIATTASGTIGM